MQNIFWLGPSSFAGDLEACGWENAHISQPDENSVYCWDDVVEMAGFVPDVMVLASSESSPSIAGMENFPCLTIFYSLNRPFDWHYAYAQAFDACLVSNHDDLKNFSGFCLSDENIWWSPAFAGNEDMPSPHIDKSVDCLFVGNNDSASLPRRAAFLRELGKLVPKLKVSNGDYRQLFPTGRIIVNQAENNELNFRVFEAMGCGGCLVTPRVGNGLDKLFVDGEHLVAYAPHDAGDAAYRINFLLEHPDICEYISAQAIEKINDGHRSIHRAQAFTDHMCDLHMSGADELVRKRNFHSTLIRENFLADIYHTLVEDLPAGSKKAAFQAAAKGDYGLSGHTGDVRKV